MARKEQELIAHCPSCKYMEVLPIVNGSLDSWLIRSDGAKVYGNYYQKDGQIFHHCNTLVKLIRFYHNALGMKIPSTTKAMKEGLPRKVTTLRVKAVWC